MTETMEMQEILNGVIQCERETLLMDLLLYGRYMLQNGERIDLSDIYILNGRKEKSFMRESK